MRSRTRRIRERGHMIAMTAIMGTVLVGATALAVDLSVNTQARRTLQNITDAAALAGARSLPSTPRQAIKEALDVLQRNSPWATNGTWLATAQAAITGTCTSANGSTCTVSVAAPSGFSGYTVKASSPPSTPKNSTYNTTSYLEVELVQSNSNSFGSVIGSGTSGETGHSIAYYAGPVGPYQYAFFAKDHAGSGNHAEQVIGDAFVGKGYLPQSSGKAGLCMLELAGPEPASDADGDVGGAPDDDLDDQGHVVFSSVPPTVGPDPAYSNGGSCPGGGTLSAQQPSPTSSSKCPSGSTATSYTSGGSTLWACYQAAPPLPAIPAPTPTKASICNATIDSSSAAGVYPVGANCTVTLDFGSGNISCVSLVLSSGSTVSVNNKKGDAFISAYGFDPTGDSLAKSVLQALSLTLPGAACGGSSINADRSVIWAPDTTTTPMPTVLSNGTTGCCSTSVFLGTVFTPNQGVSFGTNQSMEVAGSVYCGQWDVQSGNHPNPMVTYDGNAAAYVVSALRLTE